MQFEKNKEESEEIQKNCTFSPITFSNFSRKQEQTIQDLYKWKQKTEQNLIKNKEYLSQVEREKITDKPKINENSRKIADKVRSN